MLHPHPIAILGRLSTNKATKGAIPVNGSRHVLVPHWIRDSQIETLKLVFGATKSGVTQTGASFQGHLQVVQPSVNGRPYKWNRVDLLSKDPDTITTGAAGNALHPKWKPARTTARVITGHAPGLGRHSSDMRWATRRGVVRYATLNQTHAPIAINPAT
jgi:hypothetical protein